MAGMSITGDALLAAGGSLMGNVASLIAGRDNADRAFKQQKELMNLQNQYAVENWNRENRYNTPKAQMERLRSAGLNPDLMYGSGAAGLQSGSISAPSAPGSQMAPTPDFSSSVSDAAQAALAIRQADLAGSQAMKQNIENKYFEEQLMAGLEQTRAFTDLTKEQRSEVSMRCQNLSAEWNRLQEDINLLRKEGKLKDKEIKVFDRRLNAEIDYMTSSSDFTKIQKEILEDNKLNIIKLAKGQADLAETAALLTKRYGDAQAVVGLLSEVVSAGTDLVTAFTTKGAKIVGKTVEHFAGGKQETYHYSK